MSMGCTRPPHPPSGLSVRNDPVSREHAVSTSLATHLWSAHVPRFVPFARRRGGRASAHRPASGTPASTRSTMVTACHARASSPPASASIVPVGGPVRAHAHARAAAETLVSMTKAVRRIRRVYRRRNPGTLVGTPHARDRGGAYGGR